MSPVVEAAMRPLREIGNIAVTWTIIAIALAVIGHARGWNRGTQSFAQSCVVIGFCATLYFRLT